MKKKKKAGEETLREFDLTLLIFKELLYSLRAKNPYKSIDMEKYIEVSNKSDEYIRNSEDASKLMHDLIDNGGEITLYLIEILETKIKELRELIVFINMNEEKRGNIN